MEYVVRNKLKEVRLAKGLTQQELSEKSGIFPQYISRMENHRTDFIDIFKLAKLMKALGIDDFNEILEIVKI